jgi:RNA polymerase sigma-70 factor (ECF subfamily)
LAARAQLGDRAALEELLRRLQAPLGDHIRAIVRDDDLAADVLQDTLFIVCRKLGTIRDTQWVRAWAYRVATREAVRSNKRVRREHDQLTEDLSVLDEATDSPPPIDQDDLLSELPERLEAVPEAARVVLRLHYLQSLTQPEIAEALEIPLGTVKSRLAYGLMYLRKSWLPRA